jgi:membrane protein
MKFLVRDISTIVGESFVMLRRNDALILASSTAFFTTFSLSPIIVILVNVLGLYFKSESIRHKLIGKLQTIFGQQTASEIEKIVNNFMAFEGTWWITITSFLFLLFVSTTLLGIIRKSIHQLWNIRRKSSVRLKYTIKERLIGLGILGFIGLLFIVSLMLDTSLAIFRDYLQTLIPGINPYLIRIINLIISIGVVTAFFTVIFKILPEVSMRWNVAFTGGIVTALLFSLGKFILGRLLVESDLKTIFGASASFALLLLFIFYSSLIMYLGAAFTYSFAKAIDEPIKPGKYADEYEKRIVKH